MSDNQSDMVGFDATALLQTPKRLRTVAAPATLPPPCWEYTMRGTLSLPLVEPDVRWQTTPEGLLCFTLWQQDGTTATLAALLRRIADNLDAQALA